MPLSRRYSPEWAPGESATIGMDYSAVIPPGVGITSASLRIQTNTVQPNNAFGDWEGPNDPGVPEDFDCTVRGRVAYVSLAGGVEGTDYQFVWTVIDTMGNVWPRTALLLCARTS